MIHQGDSQLHQNCGPSIEANTPISLQDLAELSDAVLVQLAKAGNLEAADALVRRHWPGLLHQVRRACAHCFFAEDLCQEASLSAIRRLPHLRDPEAFGAWLNRLLANEIHHCCRKCKKVGTEPLQNDSLYMETILCTETENHCADDFEIVWAALQQHFAVGHGRLGRVAAFMLQGYEDQQEFPAVRAIALGTECSHGTAERLRDSVLHAWQGDLTRLGLRPLNAS